MSRPPLPPFSEESAIQEVRAAEDAWNTRGPARVMLAYTLDGRGATALNSRVAAPKSRRS
jgi:nuclear transport factor 2 (NTF2) superfamily protein